MQSLVFALNATMPIVLTVALGYFIISLLTSSLTPLVAQQCVIQFPPACNFSSSLTAINFYFYSIIVEILSMILTFLNLSRLIL